MRIKMLFLALCLAMAAAASASAGDRREPIAPLGDWQGDAILASEDIVTLRDYGDVVFRQWSVSGEAFLQDPDLMEQVMVLAAESVDAGLAAMDYLPLDKGGQRPGGSQCPGNNPGSSCFTIDFDNYMPCGTCGIIVITIITIYDADGEIEEVRIFVNEIHR